MPLLILQLLFLSSGGGIWEEIMDVLLGGSLIFKLLCPHELCTAGLSGPPFVSRVLGGAFNKQLLRMGCWRIIRQTNSLLMSQARRRFQA